MKQLAIQSTTSNISLACHHLQGLGLHPTFSYMEDSCRVRLDANVMNNGGALRGNTAKENIYQLVFCAAIVCVW